MLHPPAAALLSEHLDLLLALDRSFQVLDLACGNGRNGLLLAEHGIDVVFADRSLTALQAVGQRLAETGLRGKTWQVELEQPGTNPLSGQRYGAIIVFRYLHRPLFPALREAVIPGGLAVYETFTIEQRRFGRPCNPDFLLRPGELKALFQGWEIIHHFDGLKRDPDRGVSQIIARKP